MQNIIRRALPALAVLALPLAARADEAKLVLPDLASVQFLGMSGRSLLLAGLVVCALGLAFGIRIFAQLKGLPVHRAMLEVSELIYETCKTYLITQGKFILILEGFIGVIMVVYFGWLRHFEAEKVIRHRGLQPARDRRQLRRGLVRDPGEHLRQLPDRLRGAPGKPFLTYAIPLKGGHVHRHDADQHRAPDDALHPALRAGDYAGSCFIGFAIGESLGASALRIAGGISPRSRTSAAI